MEQNFKVILWTRVSSEEQGNRFSLEAQLKELKEYCLKNKYNIIREFTSKTSGFKFDNPELQELLDYIQDTKDIYAILFTEGDRLMRDPQITGFIKYTCLIKKIKLIAINEEVKSEDNESQELSDSIMLAVKKFEVMRRVRRSNRGRKIKFENGGHIGKPPFGYETVVENGRKTIKPNGDAITVQNIFTDYNKLDERGRKIWGYRSLAIKYNLFTDKEKKILNSMLVKLILHNIIYIGYVKGQLNNKLTYKKGYHTPVVQENVFFGIEGNEKLKELLEVRQ